jgi:uncharacterized coiled-coil DUF342 family protein
MNEEERKALSAELEEKKKELASLRSKLNELNTEKEAWFDKKRRATNSISDISRNIRDAKGKRNTFTKQVKDSKGRREELNKLLKDKLDEMKKLQQEKVDITKKFGLRVDPSRIRQEIDQLEFKIETEALPFSIEQRLMRQINDRKHALEQSKEVSDVFDRIHRLRKDLDKIRQKADETHKKVQSKAEMSQQFHEDLVESSGEIKQLRANEEEALKRFVDLKTKFNEQNDLVKVKLDEINAIRVKLGDIDFEEKRKTKKEEENKIAEQERSVEEKIKKGLKITTDDLLVFQAREQMAEKFDREERQRKSRQRSGPDRRRESPQQQRAPSPKPKAEPEKTEKQ